jgi:hypothetical protein
MSRRWISIALWAAALLVAVGLAFVQRLTGPSYPVRGKYRLAGETVRYSLPRSHGGAGGLTVSLRLPSAGTRGAVMWRRFPTDEGWRTLPLRPMSDTGGSTALADSSAQTDAFADVLAAEIPHQPPAGKVEYWVLLEGGGEVVRLPADEAVVARFRGSVSGWILIPHIIAMFASLLLATRALFEVLRPGAQARTKPSGLVKAEPTGSALVLASMVLLVLGGLILGPLVQRSAFGALWTGWPFGSDLTDNKTLIAFLAWLPAVILAFARRRTRTAVIIGWIVMMGVFSIPHSLRGSELDWENDVPHVKENYP